MEISLFAENPSLAKPIQMNFDPQGRLWVATSEVYPQVKPGQVANDKIVVLQDTTGDGRADKTEIFAEGLFIPTAIEPGNGGCYVGQSTELLHFKDTNGDCQLCDAECNGCTGPGPTNCMTCKKPNKQSSDCSACVVPHFMDPVSQFCFLCHPLCKSCTGPGETGCKECIDSYYKN